MGEVINNVVDLAAYRRYRDEQQKTWRPQACAVCEQLSTDDLSGWVYSFAVSHFVCSEHCYQKAERAFTHDSSY